MEIVTRGLLTTRLQAHSIRQWIAWLRAFTLLGSGLRTAFPLAFGLLQMGPLAPMVSSLTDVRSTRYNLIIRVPDVIH